MHGYKSEIIRDYFLNFYAINSDVTIELKTNSVEVHSVDHSYDWQVTLAYTGELTMTGARIARAAERYIGKAEHYAVTHGDGLTDADLAGEFDFHLSHGKIGTVLGVNPPSRFGEFHMEGDELVDFVEKPERHSAWINGGYFSFGANSPNTCLPTRGASWSAIPWRVWLATGNWRSSSIARSGRVWTPGDRIGQALSSDARQPGRCSGRARRRR